MLVRAFVDKNVITERNRQRAKGAHLSKLQEIKSKEGSYKLGRIQSTERKLEFNLNSHRRRRMFDKSQKEKQVDTANYKLLKKLVDIQQGRDPKNLLK